MSVLHSPQNASDTRSSDTRSGWLDRPLRDLLSLRLGVVIFAVILLLAVFTRFYHLGDRVMSHDESLHTYFSWQLYKGAGYEHNPMMHGPLQFHLIAFSFFLFGDSDFTARVPHAAAAVLAFALLWLWRRYLGRKGTLIAAGLMLISPYMLYYARYARNEALIMPLAVLMLWATLRYLETGANRYLTWLVVSLALHFVIKETAFIYTAQLLVFLGMLLLDEISRSRWERPEARKGFFGALLFSAAGLMAALGVAQLLPGAPQPAPVEGAEASRLMWMSQHPMAALLVILALLGVLVALYLLLTGYNWRRLFRHRPFVLIVVVFSLVMPMLAPVPMHVLGWDALDYSATGRIHTLLFLVPLIALAAGLGWLWNFRVWLVEAALFYGIFAVFQTTVFTNGGGLFSGLVGALGYWLQQQGVHRGSQPWYYYLLIQIPIYEYLPALGALLAAVWWPWHQWRSRYTDDASLAASEENNRDVSETRVTPSLVFLFLAYWSMTSLLAYTAAGEKMPWLTVHIALPMILLTGWFLGKLADAVDWRGFTQRRGWVLFGLMLIFVLAAAEAVRVWLSAVPPFQGDSLPQLQATANFLVGVAAMLASAAGLVWASRDWQPRDLLRAGALLAFGLLALLTTHTAIQATYYNYDQANEYLVYAHSARGVKTVMTQVEEISERTTDGLGIQVAYDSAVSWPFSWYLRNFPNQRFYGSEPSRDLRDVPVVLAGAADYDKVDSVTGDDYLHFDYIRMVWPNQDYFNLTTSDILAALRDPAMRSALFQIWLNRDFTDYFRLKQEKGTWTPLAENGEPKAVNMANILADWQPSDRMRLYVRKDIAAKIWEYGAVPAAAEEPDSDANKEVVLSADKILGMAGVAEGQFQRPRGIAVAPDGTLYVADTGNFRIQHLAPDGSVLHVWGTYGNLMDGGPEAAPPGTFNEPWDVAVGPDGYVYVVDTWNHRIQKFTAEGEFVTMWGTFGNDGSPLALWGPRAVVVDAQGHVFVTDTGNKRVVVYDTDGNPLGQFGHGGVGMGEFAEPVGLALDAQGNLYVADTWNQRVQVFAPSSDLVFVPVKEWPVNGWYGQSADNKPYLAVNAQGHAFVGDPEGYRVMEFNAEGTLLRWWGRWGVPPNGMGIVGGLVTDGQNGLWVVDSEHGQILHFTLSELAEPAGGDASMP